MIKINKVKVVLFTGLFLYIFTVHVKAGDPSRAGQSGASELLIDPWAESIGFAEANTSTIHGVEAQFLDVAGTAFCKGTEIMLSSTNYLVGSGITIAAVGITQHIGESGALGLSVMSMNFGTINTTTYDNPEGGVGTFTPQFINIGMSYARGFSDNIYGGINVKLISESIANVDALGVAVDAGIQYVAGKEKQIHFGIALKNVGPPMSYKGDGFAFTTLLPPNPTIATGGSNTTGQIETAEQRSQSYELPSLVNIGAGYDFFLVKDSAHRSMHRISVCANFNSNSFIQDQEMLGVEYGFKDIFSVRAGYDFESGIFDALSTNPVTGGRLTAYTGPCVGASLQYPVGKKHKIFGISYAYRASNPFSGSNTVQIKIDL